MPVELTALSEKVRFLRARLDRLSAHSRRLDALVEKADAKAAKGTRGCNEKKPEPIGNRSGD